MAYALESLVQILEQDYHYLIDNKPQIESLLQKTHFLKDLLDKISPLRRKKIKLLEISIRDAAHKAEDIIESHMRDQILSFSSSLLLDLKDVLEKFDSITEDMSKIVETDPDLFPSVVVSSSLTPEADPSSKNRVVGFDKDLFQLKDRLIGQQSTLQIIPIVGMGGSGKTTLARTLYNDSLIAKHFDTCAWITISQEYSIRVTLLALLECLRKFTDKMHQESDDKLGEYVHKTLKDRRYLIVVDDIWDTHAWDLMRRFFPDDGNGSRIMLTTRESNVANYASSSSYLSYTHEMNPLDEDSSWELLVEKVFGQEVCPPYMEGIGREIAKKCGGLPLAISVMGGLLSASEKTVEFWDLVENNVSSEVAKHDLQSSNILSLSYNYLPYHMKPCFLYVGAFPEDYEIRASKIIKLWIAEGFVKPLENDSSLEDAAEVYLKALVDRNLLSVRRLESNGKVKTFSIHDLLRELCQRESGEDKFLWSKTFDGQNITENVETLRRVSAHPLSQPCNNTDDKMKSTPTPLTRSFLCIGFPSLDLAPMFLYLGLLRVLDVFELEFYQFPIEILQLVNLRYLAFTCHSALPSSISKLRNLQTLIIRRLPWFRAFALPSQVWEMTQLRHIKSKETCIWFYPKTGEIPLQDKLYTLSNLQMYGFTNQVLEKIPNVRKLGLSCNVAMHTVIDLANHLNKLEKLKCFSDWTLPTRNFLSYLTFPPSLQKLTLSSCRIPWGFMTTIGSLPNLKQLKIQYSDFQGAEWMPNKQELEPTEPEWELTEEGVFPELEFLLLEDLNLVHWTADDISCFLSLKHLVIRYCCSLKEILFAIGESVSLEKIEVDESNPSVVASAKQIEKEKLENGDEIQVLIYSG